IGAYSANIDKSLSMLRRQKSEVGSRTSESLTPPRLTLVRPDAASQREAGGFRFPEQVVPIIRRIAVAQPSVEDHVGVCPRAGFAEGCFVVHPGVDDRLGDRCHWGGGWKVRRARPSTNGSGSARHPPNDSRSEEQTSELQS